LQNKTKRHGTNDTERPRRLDSAGVAIGAAGRGWRSYRPGVSCGSCEWVATEDVA
jgi:hypothetical protein